MFLTKARLMTGFLALSLATSALIGTALARGGRGGGGYGRSSMSRGYSSYPAGAPRSYNSHSYSNSNLHPTNPFAPGATNLGAGGSNASPTTNVKPIQLGPGRNLGASSASKISQTGKLQPGVGAGTNLGPSASKTSQTANLGPVGVGPGANLGSNANKIGATSSSIQPKISTLPPGNGTPMTPKMPPGNKWGKSGWQAFGGMGGGGMGGGGMADAAPADGVAAPASDPNAAPIASPDSASAVDLSAMTMIVGSWTAQPAKDVTLQATFQPDRTFSWTFFVNGKPKSFAGTYSLNGKSLVMVRDGSNEKLEGLLTLNDPSHFNLKANGSEPGDTGLSFAR
jgi:hypothetical protein